MSYAFLDLEWDETWKEMHGNHPRTGDKVLCLCPEVSAGELYAMPRGCKKINIDINIYL